MRFRVKKLLTPFVLMAAPFLLINGFTVLGLGAWRTAGIELLLLPALVAFVTLVAALFISLSSRYRPQALNMVATSLGIVLGCVFGAIVGRELRMYAFELAATRAAPLVAAVSAYEKDHGVPPRTLEELVPAHLPKLPDRLPPLRLVSGEVATREYQGNPWALVALVPGGLINWDTFLYLPKQNYPATGYGGALQRIGDWAYVHE
ncbi:MAG: hypothetical protein RR101_12080 [Burkholderiaceae bacterium]